MLQRLKAYLRAPESKASRTAQVLAFANGDYGLVQSLAREVGKDAIGFKPRLKASLAALPEFLRAPFVALALRANPTSIPQGQDKR